VREPLQKLSLSKKKSPPSVEEEGDVREVEQDEEPQESSILSVVIKRDGESTVSSWGLSLTRLLKKVSSLSLCKTTTREIR
jgi:hypothetical protein